MQLRGWISLPYHILNTLQTWNHATFISFQYWNTFTDISMREIKKCESLSKYGCENILQSSSKMALWNLFIIGRRLYNGLVMMWKSKYRELYLYFIY
jgi:hypothetical protein